MTLMNLHPIGVLGCRDSAALSEAFLKLILFESSCQISVVKYHALLRAEI